MIKTAALLLLVLFVIPARADFVWGVGYNNPVKSTLGVNAMKLWNHIAFEAGLGFNHQPESGSNSLAADVDLKYLFTSGFIRPFVQGGVASSGSHTDPFAGGGFFMMGFNLNVYFAVVFVKQTAVQFGISFP